MNCTFSVTADAGFNVTGNDAPDIVKPVPVSAAALMVTGVVPVDVSVNDCDVGVLTMTLPKAMLPGLMLRVATDGTNCRANTLETPLSVAFMFTVCFELTGATVSVKGVCNTPAATMTPLGTVTAGLSLDKATVTLAVAASLRYTEQPLVPPPVIDVLPQETELRAGVAAETDAEQSARQHSATKRSMCLWLSRVTLTLPSATG